MRRFNITVNGKAYDVAVEEVAGGAPAAPATAPAAPAPLLLLLLLLLHPHLPLLLLSLPLLHPHLLLPQLRLRELTLPLRCPAPSWKSTAQSAIR